MSEPLLPPEASVRAVALRRRLASPISRFLAIEASSGVLLLLMAAVALLWANGAAAESYHALWHAPVGVQLGPWRFERDLHFLVNEVLMVIFFFVVGLEIRREMHGGELSELRRAALPAIAAVGGMLAPAAIYLMFNPRSPQHEGWGVPMATDIAFAVGVLALAGRRVPAALRVLLLALAVIDDIGAIVVIALFYSAGVEWWALGAAALAVLSVLVLQRFGVRRALGYVPSGVALWAALLAAGIHPSLSGVLLGLLTPAAAGFGAARFVETASHQLEAVRTQLAEGQDERGLLPPLARVAEARREALPPVITLEHLLHPWVAYGIMPLFALVNAGVTFGEVQLGGAGTTVALGVALGLVLGKPLGVFLACFAAVKLGLCRLPTAVGWRGVLLVGLIAGVGFTMALFVAQLAFSDAALLGTAKLAILVGSAVAGFSGVLYGHLVMPPLSELGASITPELAESSTEH